MTSAPVRCSPGLPAARGFTLLELAVALAMVGLLATLVVPRLGVLRGVALESSARQLAARIRFLREEAALRNQTIRLAVDPERGVYRAAVLVETPGESRFVERDALLFRPVALPASIAIDMSGRDVRSTVEGLPATRFSPDGWADAAVIHLDDRAGKAFSIVIDPALISPRVLDRRVEARDLLNR